MAKKIKEIEGIGPVFAEKLGNAGVLTVESLLEKGASRSGRKAISEASGIDEGKVLNWVNKADLFRIKGIAEEYSDLLEAAGVDTVVELAKRNAENLLAKILEVNATKKLVRRVPTLSQIEKWIEQAKQLPRAIHY